MLFLNKSEIQKLDQNMVQASVEKAYNILLSKDYRMPDRVHVSDGPNSLLLMPCFSGQYFSTKLVSVFPEAVKHGQPAVNGVMVLSDNISGKPLAIMDGAALTAQRTGAVGGLAVKFLTPEKLKTAGVLGAGVQGFSQARYLMFNRKIETLYLYDVNLEMAGKMMEKLKQEFSGVDYIITKTAAELVEKSGLIIAATTSHTPLFNAESEDIRGKTFISIGSYRPDMQEFPDKVIEVADTVFVDTLFAMEESGDIAAPLKKQPVIREKIKEFSTLFRKNTYAEKSTIFFKSVGMGLFDLTVSSAIYNLALEKKIGRILDF
jgi:ornithine cyclodeaminase/alanine dehydrogenase-like protein (mu-crystallin family)